MHITTCKISVILFVLLNTPILSVFHIIATRIYLLMHFYFLIYIFLFVNNYNFKRH